jgi:hypothetical protein
MLVASSYPFLDVFWTILIFFLWVAWFMLLFRFSATSSAGTTSAAGQDGLVDLRDLPAVPRRLRLPDRREQGHERARPRQMQSDRQQFDQYVRETATTGGSAAEIERAKGLLDSGVITQPEFEAIKAKAIS